MRRTLTISKGNLYFKVSEYSQETFTLIRHFCKRNLTKWSKVNIPGQRKAVYKATHVFARTSNDKSEVRLPIGQLDSLKRFLVNNGYDSSRFLELTIPNSVPAKASISLRKEYENPRENQLEWLEYQLGEGAIKVNQATMGVGKFQSLRSLVKVPNGWVTMGSIRVGDIVTASDGTPARVLGVFPQGKQRMFKITTDDGRETLAGLDHLWKIYDTVGPRSSRYNRGKEIRSPEQVEENRWRIVDTKELLRLQEMKHRWGRVFLPLNKSEIVEDKKLPIDPYVLGVLLGDGCISSNEVKVVNESPFIFDKMRKLLGDDYELRRNKWLNSTGLPSSFAIKYKGAATGDSNRLVTKLKLLGLMGCRSWEKFIPNKYLHGSHDQRLALLQGLLDTDGTVSAIGVRKRKNRPDSTRKGGTITFSSASEDLSKGVQYLVRSLGGIAKIATRVPTFTHNGVKKKGRVEYRVFIRHPDPNSLFTIPHKKERANPTQYSDNLKLRIKSVVEVEPRMAQCIAIDHPDRLYVTDDFIVTHNTYMSLYTSQKLACRTLITIQPRYIATWLTDMQKTLELSEDDVLLYEDTRLERLIDAFSSGESKQPIVIIPITRIMGYLKRCRDDASLPCLDDIYDAMGIGLRIVDETHESFHEITNTLLFGNIEKTLVLSGTLTADDPFLNNMYLSMFPREIRLKEPEDEHYVDVEAALYKIDTRKYRVNYMQFGSYNDLAFEGSILRNKGLFKLYKDLLLKLFTERYMDIREEGTKCLIFVSRIDMALRFKEILREHFAMIDVDTFLGTMDKKDPYKYLRPEVIITTPGSLGTGKDVPGLVTCINFHTVKSSQRNKQMIGRLRNLFKSFGGRITPRFVFTVCESIQPHMDYFGARKEAFKAKSKSFKRIDTFLRTS